MSGAMERTSSSKNQVAIWTDDISGDAALPGEFTEYWQMPSDYRILRFSVRLATPDAGYIAFGRFILDPVLINNLALFYQAEIPLIEEFTWIGGQGYELLASDYFIFAIESDTVAPNIAYVSWVFEQI